MKPIPQHATISLSFDYQQRNQQLSWHAVEDGHNARHSHGPHAGGMWFDPGTQVDVLVTGGTVEETLSQSLGFSIVQCCIVTRPHAYDLTRNFGRQFAPPSPFEAPHGQAAAVVMVTDFQPEKATPDAAGVLYYSRAYRSAQPLTVAGGAAGQAFLHRWEMSFVLTVQIVDERSGARTLRVFTYDPETEVGNGMNS
jgi:hypothetical protein